MYPGAKYFRATDVNLENAESLVIIALTYCK